MYTIKTYISIITIDYSASARADYNQSKINADYAAVGEQSGIFSADDGFQINVGQHADLKGGIMTGTVKTAFRRPPSPTAI